MIFWVSLLIIGGSYAGWRFSIVSNKRVFFRSPLFLSLAGSLAILLGCILVVNFFPRVEEHPSSGEDITIPFTPTVDVNRLDREGAYFHIQVIESFVANAEVDSLAKLEHYYDKRLFHRDPARSSLANFGSGVIALYEEEYQQALNKFERVKDRQLPYLNFCIGKAFLGLDSIPPAEKYFLQELSIAHGNGDEAFTILLELYEEERNYIKLHELLAYPSASELFPEDLARETVLYAGDLRAYFRWTLNTIQRKTNLPGFIAALAISIIWLVYLVRLNIFHPNKFFATALMFLSGIFSIIIILLFNDLHDLLIPWEMDGAFLNDLFYTTVMIGIPEEFTKLFPVLVLITVARLREPTDLIIYASASALGFAFIENLFYFQDISNGIIHGRAYLSAIGHMVASSIVVYGFIIGKFKRRKKTGAWSYLLVSFLIGSIVHGLYDFLIFHEMTTVFFLFFIFIIQVWVIIINNCLNNSSSFSYTMAFHSERSRLFIALALTSIFALEYLLVGFSKSAEEANTELIRNSSFAGFLIIFFSSNLSSFNLVRGYWRDVYFSSREKRGYGTLQSHSLFTSWYFVNSIRAHNYVGFSVRVYNDQYNHTLAAVLDQSYEGKIVNRLILYDGDDPDPHWFIVKLETPVPLADVNQRYVLVKLRNQHESLLYEEEVQVFFKAIPDIQTLKAPRPQKDQFPFYGWAYIAMPKLNE
jgi:RsiW-degrading membrane proteinase PrsW (M82 family)